MIRQRVDLHECDWYVTIFYDVRPQDTDKIMDALCHMGCADRHLHKAERLLRSGVPNEGLTYSSPYARESVIAVGHASSPLELCNTLLHEVDHLQVAICKADGLRTDGEDAAYLMGDITESIARNAWITMRKMFLYLI